VGRFLRVCHQSQAPTILLSRRRSSVRCQAVFNLNIPR
jgi:hypothetical protein